MRQQKNRRRTRPWIRWIIGGLVVAASPIMPIASAHASTDFSAAFDGASDFETVAESEMAEARGGYRGVSFGVYFSGSISSAVNTGDLPEGMTVTQSGDNQVQLQAALGDFGGANGLFQFTNVVGDLNVVNNSIVINVMVVPDLPSDVSAAWR